VCCGLVGVCSIVPSPPPSTPSPSPSPVTFTFVCFVVAKNAGPTDRPVPYPIGSIETT
jgi:hypothetical protein